MATQTPTILQELPNSGRKMVFFTGTMSANDTFSVSSHFSSVDHAFGFRTIATGTVVTMTISGTTVTVGTGPSSETVSGFVTGIG